MNYKGLVVILFGGVFLILLMVAFVSNMYQDMLKLSLEMEYVVIKVEDNTMNVTSIMGYHNPDRKNVPKHFKFPVAYAQNFSTPTDIDVLMRNVMEKPTIGEEGKFIEWTGTLGAVERSEVKLSYKQQTLTNQIVYPLTSEDFPRKSMKKFRAKIYLPVYADHIRCSYADSLVIKEEESHKILIIEEVVFTPENDLIVEWN